jgi:UDP-2-acetamido-2-deoxy-ribo-hexuluronate aminotransferase
LSRIPFVDLAAQYLRVKPQVDAGIQRVLDHGHYIMGPEVEELETALCAFSGCSHAIGVASGTDALLMALLAEGVGPGHAVFLPSFTFTASAEVVLLAGAVPVFVEVNERTFNLDVDHLKKQIAATKSAGTLKPKAIIAVDLFGLPADYCEIANVADDENLFLIADSAQSFGATIGGTRVGNFASITTTSFYPAKPLGCYGDGGALLTNDSQLAERLRSIRQHGEGRNRYENVRVGINGRLDTIQAAVLLAKLAIFDDELTARDKLAHYYDDRLADVATTPLRRSDRQSSWAQYSILLDDRDKVAARLEAEKISTAIYYPIPTHLQPAYAAWGEGAGSLPVSEGLCQRILSLPMHPYMDETTAERICAAVVEAAH